MGEFKPYKPLETPVLFLVFKRLDTTKQVFEQIRKAKPPRLYIAADGPRAHVKGEKEKVKAVREYVLSNIDWKCEVKTLFRDKNLGCGKAVSEAITWFFENEDQGIILEDDTVPSLSFFWFCEELLDTYKDDKRIWHIGGCNFQDGRKRGDGDYYFSVYNHIWGWASWSDRWKYYDFKLEKIETDMFIRKIFSSKKEIKYWCRIFWKMKSENPIDTWDYQWTFTMWFYDGVAILPNVNMVSNIGFGIEGTHTHDINNPLAKMERFEMMAINHPVNLAVDREADEYTFKKYFAPKLFYIRLFKKASIIIKRYL
jgi:hypothetical protein